MPIPRVESALRGKYYDPYIRRIVWEGVLDSWIDQTHVWPNCPVPSASSSSLSSGSGLVGLWQAAYSTTTKVVQSFFQDGVDILPDGPVVCPYFWAQPNHDLNCDVVWPEGIDKPSLIEGLALPELDTPEYAGTIMKDMIIERVLAQGGIRLAKLLNYLFADESALEEMEDYITDVMTAY